MSHSPTQLFLAWMLLTLTLMLGACSDTKDETTDEYSEWTAEQFYREARDALNEKRWEKATKLYEKLEARYPFGKYATQAQLDVAYAYYKNDEPDSAIAAADRFIKLNPSHPSVDYAYYIKGLVNYNRGIGFIDRFIPTDSSQRDPGSAMDAYKDFEELLRRFPDSRYADDSRKRLIALRNNLAMHEIHVADFYMRRGAYLAAARRCAEVVRKYERTQAVPVALEIMEQAYRKLGMTQLADDAKRVYDANYSEGAPGQAAKDVDYEPSAMQQAWDFLGMDKD
ncbi:MAG: outer membrane protein assembly factor BamD [Methylococcus sp.]|nr:MAG: outer membrane protein assembly factor BamD [Methylococcus sp.]